MTPTGKIARLPHEIREQLNHRLRAGHKARSILAWLNSLPEARAILETEFDGRPITAVNLTAWKHGGYGNWQARQQALEFLHDLEDEHNLGHKSLTAPLAEKLAHWVALHFAACAQTITTEQNPQKKWARLHELCLDITRLRRCDLHAEQLAVDREWLALEKSNTEDQREKDFWKWTERPDIRQKLFPDKEGGLSPETLEKIERELRLM